MKEYTFDLVGKKIKVNAFNFEFTDNPDEISFYLSINDKKIDWIMIAQKYNGKYRLDLSGNESLDYLADSILDIVSLDEIGTTRKSHVIDFCGDLETQLIDWVEEYSEFGK